METAFFLGLFLILGALLTTVLGVCDRAPEVTGDRRQDKSKLSIATYNAYWLFDGINDSLAPWQSAAEADVHLDRIASVLRAIDADIVALVEVEGCEVAQRLSVDPQLKPLNYSVYIIPGTDTSTRQNVVLLTRVDPVTDLLRTEERAEYPMAGSQCGFTTSRPRTTGVSKHFYTYFDIAVDDSGSDRFPLLLVAAHLKAFPTDPPSCAQREGQAAILHSLIRRIAVDKSMPLPLRSAVQQKDAAPATVALDNPHVVVLGDLNDFDNTVDDFSLSRPTSRALRMLHLSTSPSAHLNDSFRTDSNTDIEPDQHRLFNVARLIRSKSARYSNWYDRNHNGVIDVDIGGELSLIDHILISNKTIAASDIATAEIAHSLYGANLTYSDHWPVVLRLDLAAAAAAKQGGFTAGSLLVIVAGLGFAAVCAVALLWMVREDKKTARNAVKFHRDL